MQKGKQSSRIHQPLLFRSIDLVYRLRATYAEYRHALLTAGSTARETVKLFASMVRLLTNYEDRQLRKRIRAEERRRELKAIGRRILREN